MCKRAKAITNQRFDARQEGFARGRGKSLPRKLRGRSKIPTFPNRCSLK
jgi:hypothetical protein